MLTDYQVRKARKMWQLTTQFKPERLFLIDPKALEFAAIDEHTALGEYSFSMDITSRSNLQGVERSQWLDLLNLFAGLTPVMIQNFGMPPNLPEIARRLLVRGFGEKVVEDILPMLNAAAQQMAQAQQQGQQGQQMPGMDGGPDGEPINVDPASQEAVQAGRDVSEGIGPLNADAFQDAPGGPSEGRQAGNAVTQ
jgi:hypothetical protein